MRIAEVRPLVARATTLLTLSVVAAACGSDDAAPATTGAPTAASTAATADETTAAETTPAPSATSAPGATPVAPAPISTPPTVAPTTADAEPAVTFTEIAVVDRPVDLSWRAGDDGLYVAEQDGRVVRLADGEVTTVLDATELTDAQGERGLLGVALSPAGDFAYVNFTDLDGDTNVVEHPVAADGTFGEGRTLLTIDQPYANHNGGEVVFGPDGLLYVGMGDGGSGGDPERRALDLSTPLGKVLRIDPTPAASEPYTVPADNPYVGQAGADPRLWSIGLRNPWRMSFDRATGDLWIGDVGQGEFEEIDVAPAAGGVDAGRGVSFGWSAFEGDERFNEDVPADGHLAPLATYPHGEAGCSVSGGVRARDGSSLDGWYLYADYCSGRVVAQEVLGEGAALSAGRTVELGRVDAPTAVVEGPGGEVYVLSGAGPILRLDPA